MNFQTTAGFKTATTLIGKAAAVNAHYMLRFANHNDKSQGYATCVQKLSDKYNSRSTNYHGCYNMAPFIINTDKATIVAAGYSKLCNAIISLDMTHPAVIALVDGLHECDAAEVALLAAKNQHNEDMQQEAAGIEADSQFCEEIKAITESGPIKSDKMCTAFKGLLNRLGIAEIKTDFWAIFRIVKSNADL